jgi:hypothetical protein
LRARVIHLFIWCAALGACASAPLKPEAALPTRAQLAALLAAPGPGIKNIPATFTLDAPRIILEGNPVLVRCFVPADLGHVQLRVALEGVDATTRESDGGETALPVRPGCGAYVASCALQTSTGLVRRLSQDVQVRGGMCEADGGVDR